MCCPACDNTHTHTHIYILDISREMCSLYKDSKIIRTIEMVVSDSYKSVPFKGADIYW